MEAPGGAAIRVDLYESEQQVTNKTEDEARGDQQQLDRKAQQV